MEDNEKNKKMKISLEERKKVFVRKLEDLELKNKLLGTPELFKTEVGSDEYLDTLSLKIKLNGGQEFTLEEYLSENLVEYRSHFYQEFYDVTALLHGLPIEVMKEYVKPECARDHTLQFIYARFLDITAHSLPLISEDSLPVFQSKVYQLVSK
jgi:hypothetical protein